MFILFVSFVLFVLFVYIQYIQYIQQTQNLFNSFLNIRNTRQSNETNYTYALANISLHWNYTPVSLPLSSHRFLRPVYKTKQFAQICDEVFVKYSARKTFWEYSARAPF